MTRLFAFSLTLCLALCMSNGFTFAQHDGARDAMRHIAKDKFDKVDETLRNKKPNAGDAEAAFVKSVSFSKQGKLDEALAAAKKAISLGIPPERYAVNLGADFAKLKSANGYVEWFQGLNVPKLIHGPMLGNVTDTEASIWVRVGDAKQVVVKTASGIVSEAVTINPSGDHSALLSIKGLQPAQDYAYQVIIDGKECAKGSLRTRPANGTAGTFKVGFGGGAGFVPEWEYMWDTISGFDPDAFLMLGDNVYIDLPQSPLVQNYCYFRRQSRPEWKRFTKQTPIYSIWDDHDFGTNDCVPGPEIDNPSWKREVWNRFRRNWANPSYGGGKEQPGCWYDFRIGDVHFVMLDGRYYRDLKGGTMLGPVQKAWLFDTLEKSTATFKVLVSPVPFTAGIKKGSRDPWDGFPKERESIFKHIEDKRVEGVFMVAADRHRTDLRITTRPNGYDLYEFESSRLTNHHTHPVVPTDGLVWGYNKTCSFGLMTFDTAADDPQVKFECVSIDGDVIHTHVLKRNALEFK